jgi:type II secretory ATPase GspE/PulE/Tfp pilus assembly ATPase PilB-like protein
MAIRQCARVAGTRSLEDEGKRLAGVGVTTHEEVARVLAGLGSEAQEVETPA